jgi:hypothetical protein
MTLHKAFPATDNASTHDELGISPESRRDCRRRYFPGFWGYVNKALDKCLLTAMKHAFRQGRIHILEAPFNVFKYSIGCQDCIVGQNRIENSTLHHAANKSAASQMPRF